MWVKIENLGAGEGQVGKIEPSPTVARGHISINTLIIAILSICFLVVF